MDCCRRAPVSMGLSRQEYWNGPPFPTPGGAHNPGIKQASLSPAPAGGFFTSSATWKAPLKTQQLGILKTQLTKIQGIEIIHTLPVER